MSGLKLGSGELDLKSIGNFLKGGCKIEITSDVRQRVVDCRTFVESKLNEDKAYYGINTGFGLLANKRIPKEQLEQLQTNLILSHASGVGEPLPKDVVKLMMLLRASVLSMGYSGVRFELLDLLVKMIEKEVIPYVPCQGSVGASGDLAPLAHLALAMIGEGNAYYADNLMPAAKALKEAGLAPVRLQAKEGLALVNGTQMMTALASVAMLKAFDMLMTADIAGALSIEGLRGSIAPFDARIHDVRGQSGQKKSADTIRKLLDGSQIIASHKGCSRVQDPYSMRCIPQVHGAVRDLVEFARGIIERELNACTDNPLVFAKTGDILSGGNFHGEPVAFACDVLAIGMTELGNISERRVEQMTNPKNGELPFKFLTANPGLNSGFMIPHVVSGALASENKTLSHPASVDTVPSSGGQEDHVSMGPWAARKLHMVLDNLEKILAIELLSAAQAVDLHEEKHPQAAGTGAVYSLIREKIPFMATDRFVGADIETIIGMLKDRDILKAAGHEKVFF